MGDIKLNLVIILYIIQMTLIHSKVIIYSDFQFTGIPSVKLSWLYNIVSILPLNIFSLFYDCAGLTIVHAVADDLHYLSEKF